MDLDFPGETSGASLYFAPGFALGYAVLVAHLCGVDKAEDAARFFAAHDFTDTFAYGISPDHWHPWSRVMSLIGTPHTQAWSGPHTN